MPCLAKGPAAPVTSVWLTDGPLIRDSGRGRHPFRATQEFGKGRREAGWWRPSREVFDALGGTACLVVSGICLDFCSNFPGVSMGSVIFWPQTCYRKIGSFFVFPWLGSMHHGRSTHVVRGHTAPGRQSRGGRVESLGDKQGRAMEITVNNKYSSCLSSVPTFVPLMDVTR